jgi:hypothetical protein
MTCSLRLFEDAYELDKNTFALKTKFPLSLRKEGIEIQKSLLVILSQSRMIVLSRTKILRRSAKKRLRSSE